MEFSTNGRCAEIGSYGEVGDGSSGQDEDRKLVEETSSDGVRWIS
jgi:hypothetical protein